MLRLGRATFTFAASAMCAIATLAARGDDAAARFAAQNWSQPRGVASGTSRVDVAAVMSQPKEAWRVKFASLDSDPVVWGGTVFIAATERQGRRLFAYDLDTGARIATSSPLSGKGRVFLAACQGFVAAVEPTDISIFGYRSNQLTPKGSKLRGEWPYPPCVHDGYLFVNSADQRLVCIDLRAAKIVSEADGGVGRPALCWAESGKVSSIAALGVRARPVPNSARVDRDGHPTLTTCAVVDWGLKSMHLVQESQMFYGQFWNAEPNLAAMADAFLARVESAPGDPNGTWFVYSPEPFRGEGSTRERSAMLPRFISPIATEPAVVGEHAFGFSADGALIRFDADGKHSFVLDKGALVPEGARRGRATVARRVMYLENWAVDLATSRVLWCEPSLPIASPLWPAADGVALYATAEHELVALRDSRVEGTAPTAPIVKGSSGASARSLALAPDGGDGIVTSDGDWIAGKVAPPDRGAIEVERADGTRSTHPMSKTALVVRGTSAERAGEEYPVFLAFWRSLRAKLLDALEQRFDTYRKNGFLDDCRRLLTEARALGIDDARASAMERRLGSAPPNTNGNAAGQRAFYKKDEDKLREQSAASIAKAAEWCRARGMPLAASVLLARAELVLPSAPGVRDAARALVPRGFPAPDASDAGTRWMQLASAILPVDGNVVPPDDPAWNNAKAPPWNEGAFGLRSEHLFLISREPDASIVGLCLRRGETAIRVLEKLLGGSVARDPSDGGAARLDVRLHKNREEFLNEFGPEARKHMEWTSGYYLPAAHVSRFYVTRNEVTQDPLERSLESVLVHEVTHHFISDRWTDAGARAKADWGHVPGFWIVEGFARFIEEQVVEIDQRGDALDDDTVTSIDAAARIAAHESLFPLSTLLDMSQEHFLSISNSPLGVIQLRHTIGELQVTARNVFYEQSGSLVFYLMNRAGPEKRAKLLQYLEHWYAGRVEKESWKLLGYASADDLQKEYSAFLAEPGH